MYQIQFTNKMKKDVRRMQKRGKNINKLKRILDVLANGEALPKAANDHQLSGNLADFRECHIEPDWLLIYRLEKIDLILIATETGSHSDIFGM